MRNPKPLYNCTCKLDAYFLKNIIQRIICISVEIIKIENKMTLMVESANYDKASAILINQLDFLPSVVPEKYKALQENGLAEVKFKPKSDFKEYYGSVFNIQMLLMNYTFSGVYRL